MLGIAGGSGSGKTTFVKKILKQMGEPFDQELVLLHQDSYYLPSPPSHLKIHGEPNFDHPEAFDWGLLRDHIQKLRQGHSVSVPVYDYKESRRTDETILVGPGSAILVEGIFTLWDQQTRDLFDVKIYLHVDADIRFIRRLYRDVRERARTLDGIIRQYYDTVRPMHHEFLEPTRQYADIVVGEETDIAAEVVAARIQQILKESTSLQKGEASV